MSGDPDNASVNEMAVEGPYHGRPACHAIRITSNSVPITMPSDHQYAAVCVQAKFNGESRNLSWRKSSHDNWWDKLLAQTGGIEPKRAWMHLQLIGIK